MGEGLIGLIIFIVVLNVLGRILKAVTSAARSGAQQAQQQQKAPPRRTREQQILDELSELERERSEETFEEGELIEAAAVPESQFPDQAAGFESGDKPGDFKRWAEERFEKESPADTFEYRSAIEAAPAVDEFAAAEGVPAWTEKTVTARKGTALPATVQEMLGGTTSLRTAVLLSVILGPCRARNRNRRGDRIV